MDAALFRHRFSNEKPEAQRSHTWQNLVLFAYKKVDISELEERPPWSYGLQIKNMSHLMSYSPPLMEVPFEEVPELVGSRSVFISKGHAYIAMSQIVETLSTSYLGPDYLQAVHYLVLSWSITHSSQFPKEFAEIPLRDIDDIAKNSFPMCMRQVVEKLREEHHPKHGGRTQLGLFQVEILSDMCSNFAHLVNWGVGLKLDDALAFGKLSSHERITCLIPVKRSSHLLLVLKIIMDAHINISVSYCCKDHLTSQFCGENLTAALSRMGVNSRALGDVMKVRNKHYQLACTVTFEAVQGTSCEAGMNHPNQYFSDSQIIIWSMVY
ncbi:putative DNA primase large subunit, eukaryotic/archaeal [Rosa chinensis]|uniref:Putative DNA primase large subunit, eukaryotic/archaeal n=1 Tax=Rosa chinensis TaxID=74649 RepID=A0A2P6QX18_ROSCH|nr:putative DNA primase large subunit, eukaryotic/archaeal [Rosa chinensis]